MTYDKYHNDCSFLSKQALIVEMWLCSNASICLPNRVDISTVALGIDAQDDNPIFIKSINNLQNLFFFLFLPN